MASGETNFSRGATPTSVAKNIYKEQLVHDIRSKILVHNDDCEKLATLYNDFAAATDKAAAEKIAKDIADLEAKLALAAPKIEPGAKLGSGGNKDVFVVKGDESKAVGILRTGKPAASIEEEIALIKELEAQGLPTVKVYGVVEVEGRPAIVMDRYAQGSKDVVKLQDGKVRIVGDSALLNEKSVADLQKIRDIMVKNNVKIDDLQFLIKSDGSVVIADPLKVVVGQEPFKNNLRMIELLISVAQKKR